MSYKDLLVVLDAARTHRFGRGARRAVLRASRRAADAIDTPTFRQSGLGLAGWYDA
ncbi:MAG: hypothetical protein WA709_14950 [Stellaceae bacterium]